MILQALYDYYQRKGDLAPQGYEWKEIPFLIVIDENGSFVNLEDTRTIEGKNKRAKNYLVIKNLHSTGKNAWKIANVFWDHYGYVLAQAKEKDENKTQEQLKDDALNQHGSFIKLVSDLANKHPENMQFEAVNKFLNLPEQIAKVKENEIWKDCSKIPGCNLSFRIVGELKLVAEHADLQTLTIAKSKETEDEEFESLDGVCLITGEKGPIAILHTTTPIQGGNSSGKLVGFQKKSGYDSYYKEQGANASVSKKAEAAYTTALNVLLEKDSNNKLKLSDMTILFWAEKETDFENKFPFFFAAPNKDDPDRNAREIKALFDSIHSGKSNNNGDTSFYILGIAPNAARISVRFWRTGKVKDFAEKIVLHFTDLDIIHGKNDEREYFTLFNLLSNIAFEYKVENVPPNLAGKMVECIIDGSQYPATLQQQCIRRVRADKIINRIRAAILKAYLNRKNRIYINNEKQITMALDRENSNQGYLCGRLFAVLEKVQEEAQPRINTTIKDRFYGAASSTPVTVFGRLISLTNHHLAKLNPGRKTNLEKLIQEVMASVSSNGVPAHLSLDDQSRFAIGYYHQRQDFFLKKDNNINLGE